MMKKLSFILIVGLLLLPIISAHAFMQNETQTINSILIDNTKEDSFDNLIAHIMEKSHFPSMSACIIKKDHVVWSKEYGISNIEKHIEASDTTIYGICSITKTITGTALLQLYDKGLFDLDEDVNNYLPFSLRNPHFPNDPITFRMLLSHSSSLGNPQSYWNIDFYREGGPPFEGYPHPWLEQHLSVEGDLYDPDVWDATIRPGELSVYANINFDLVGYLVELISQEDFCTYCEEHIFKPLEMFDTSFNLSSYDPNVLAIPYNWYPSTANFRKNYNQVHLHYPAGGLFTSVSDLSHFMIALLNEGVYEKTRILEAATVQEMQSIQTAQNKFGRSYGLAWLFDPMTLKIGSRFLTIPLLSYSGHGGAVTYGLRTAMEMKISQDTAVIYFINSDSFLYPEGWNGHQLLRELLFFKAKTM